jgi:hypothetical protein
MISVAVLQRSQIIGVWELHSWETVVDDKVIGYPLEEQASGFLAYHPTGFMSVNISAPNRVRIPTDDPFEGDPKLLALDAKGYLSYCGPFSIVSENELIHHLRICSFENWVGTDRHRDAQLNENTLTLSTAPRLLLGKKGIGRLTWKRVTTFT